MNQKTSRRQHSQTIILTVGYYSVNSSTNEKMTMQCDAILAPSFFCGLVYAHTYSGQCSSFSSDCTTESVALQYWPQHVSLTTHTHTAHR